MLESPVPFVHLRVHSAYSLLEGAIQMKDLAAWCQKHRMPAVAVTDTNNLFGAVEFSETLAGKGVQPIMGLTLAVDGTSVNRPRSGAPVTLPSLALFAMTEDGWLNLSRLSSKAHLEIQPGETPHVDLDRLAAHADGVLCLTGGPGGPVNRLIVEGQLNAAEDLLMRLARLFPDRLYVELQRHGLPDESRAEEGLIDLAYRLALPLVATNQAYFLDRDFHEAHDALICIADGRYVMEEDRRRVTPEHFLKTPQLMAHLFDDLPEAVENTLEVARRCAFRPKKRDPILPAFPVPEGLSAADELRAQASDGLKRLIAAYPLYADEDIYWKRLDYELGVITRMRFEGYFLIVSDFMKWTRAQGIPVGVRGSGATSIVAWALAITALDPIRFGLVFERFLNPERISMPDFDIDFCQDRRGEVIRYVQEKYGHDRVAQIVTFGTLAARAAVRDVGRVLQMPYGQIDRISKLIPNQPGQQVKLHQAIANDGRLRQMARDEESVARLFEIAEKLEGLNRNASTHAAGLVIGDRPLPELAPLYHDQKADLPAVQFDYKDAETVGLVKFDFLGLKTLTVIAETEKLLAKRGIVVKAEEVPFDDRKTYEMLSRGDCVGVFQLESQGMRDLIRKLRPDRIEDIIALVALYRPGPMESIPLYTARKNGREKTEYLHPSLEPILKDTYGIMTYQEDVMLIARELGGYTMGQADILRRAMGKKDKAEMDRQRPQFVAGAKERGVPEDVADELFTQAEKFSGYGFNKGHAAAYAQVSWQTAWLKANYPAEFLCASMTLDAGSTDRLNIFRQEAERLGIAVLPPDINASMPVFSVETAKDGKSAIRYALAAVRNVGRQAMEHLAEARAEGGPFKSLFDLARRTDPRLVNKRALESLAAAGAFDALNPNRAQVFAAVDLMLAHADQSARDRSSGQVSLFGGAEASPDPKLPAGQLWDANEKLQKEFEAIGFYLSGHPLDEFKLVLKRLGAMTYAALSQSEGKVTGAIPVAGIVIDRKDKRSRESGNPYAFIRLSDSTAVFETVVFSDIMAQNDELLQPGRAVVFTVVPEWQDDQLKLRTAKVQALDEIAKSTGAGLRVIIDGAEALPTIAGILRGRNGKGRVQLTLVATDGREVDIDIPGKFQVTPDLRRAVRALPGVVDAEEV
jgi:DNA polymerase III subunit alpha